VLDGGNNLYALACMLHEMLAGEPPFRGLGSTPPTGFRAPRTSRRCAPRADGRAAWAGITLPDGAAAVSLGRGHRLGSAIADPAAWHDIAGRLWTFRGNAGCAIARGRCEFYGGLR
jgi:hypothetical protein